MAALKKKDSGQPSARDPRVRVLVVDGDRASLDETRAVLRDHGFLVLAAPSSLHAIRVLEREPVAIMLAEQRMRAGMDGLGLCMLVRRRWPKVRRVVMCRRPTGELVMQARMLADARTITRPVAAQRLVAALDEELRAAR
jgi:DNA-binding NtrC family response regulator